MGNKQVELTHRQRVRRLFAGAAPDRAIVDLGGFVTSFAVDSYLDLKDFLGFGRGWENETVSYINTLADLDQRVLAHFDIPFRRIYPNKVANFEMERDEDGSFKDEWGIVLRPMSHYYERAGQPLAGATLADLDAYPWPDGSHPSRFEGIREKARRLYEDTQYSLVAGAIWSGIFQECWYLRGMQNFLMDMILNKKFAQALLEKVAEVHIRLWVAFLEQVGDYVDMVETADDLGGQNGTLISPEIYRELIKPVQRRLYETIRQHTNAKIFYHTCGAVEPLIGDLIEIGVQVLNPIQPLPGLMDPEMLAERYGNSVIFHGGLDVQNLLTEGTPEQIRASVHHYYKVLGVDRFIMAPSPTVLPGVPPQNLLAAFEAAKEVL